MRVPRKRTGEGGARRASALAESARSARTTETFSAVPFMPAATWFSIASIVRSISEALGALPFRLPVETSNDWLSCAFVPANCGGIPADRKPA